jgi:hypothetical protein
MLLLAVTPTMGRLFGGAMPHAMAAASATPMPMAGMEDMTAEEHLAHMRHAPQQGDGAGDGRPRRGEHMGEDCAYCPLLAGLLGSTVVVWKPPMPVPMAPQLIGAVVRRAVEAPVPALGSQGPPVIEAG